MAIKDLQPRQGKVELQVEVIEKGDVREFEKFGKKGKVCNAKAKDASGEIVLSLWNEQVDQIGVGDKVKISNGYVSEYQGEMQLSTGKFGKLEVVQKGVEKGSEPIYTNSPEVQHEEEGDLSEEPVDDEEYIG
ncbi:MAG TPA: SOSS complex subunit B family protein [Candidatus Nanoarchaeia archaeon]|nr:SOSS complex subunit B family protein [Candidatus Nanoarchaeia archaeon]